MLIFLLLATGAWAYPAQDIDQDGPSSRKILGSSVVTSVSVIMDNGAETHFSDAVGRPMSRPSANSQVASPINLLNPDRYEFYTFDDNGDLVKRLMTLDEIQGIIANGDGDAFNYNSNSPTLPEKKVNDVVSNVQNVLKGEMEIHRNTTYPENLDTPDVSSTWSMILPAIFGNSGEQIKPSKPQGVMTPDTITVEQDVIIPAPVVNKPMPFTPSQNSVDDSVGESTTEYKESTTPKITKAPATILTTTQNIDTPIITVSINTNNKIPEDKDKFVKGTTKRPLQPTLNDIESVKDNFQRVTVKKPVVKPSTFRPLSTYKNPSIISRKPIVASTIALPSSTMVKISSTATTAMESTSTKEDSTSITERLTTIRSTTESLRTTTTTTEEPRTTTTEQPRTSTTEQPRTSTTEQPRTTSTEQPRTTTSTTEQPRTTTTQLPRTTTTEQLKTTTTEEPRTTPTTTGVPKTTTTEQPRTTTTQQPTTTGTTSTVQPRTTTTTNEPPRPTTTTTVQSRTTTTTTKQPRTTTTPIPSTTTKTSAARRTTITPTTMSTAKTTTTTTAPRTTSTLSTTTTTTIPTPITSSTTTTDPVRSSSTTFTNYEASPSHFIQIYDSAPTTQNINKYEETKLEEPLHKVELQTVESKPPSHSLTAPDFVSTVFIFDHKTNTKIPITTKEQLTTLLDILPNESTTEILKSSSTNNYLQEFADKFTTYNNYVASTSNIKAQTESVPTKIETSPTPEVLSQSTDTPTTVSEESVSNTLSVTQTIKSEESSTVNLENSETMSVSSDSSDLEKLSTIPISTENIPEKLPAIQDTSSEFIKIAGTTEKLPESTTFQKIYDSTEKLNTQETKLSQSTERLPESTEIDLISVPEILDQLLLTSTNIYEINTELGNQVTDTFHQTTEKLIVESTELAKDSETTPENIQTTDNIEDLTPIPTTEINIKNSIEQLLQQAIDDSNGEGTSNDEVSNKPNEEATTVKPIFEEPTTTEIIDENGGFKNEEIRFDRTTENAELTTLESSTEEPQSDLINDAVSSLLSQVISSAQEGLTTLQDFPTTTEILGTETTETIKETTVQLNETTEAVNLESVAETQTQTETIKPTEFTTFSSNTADDFETESTTKLSINSAPIETTTNFETSTEIKKLNNDIKSDESELLNTEATSYVKKDFTTQIIEEPTDKPEELPISTDNILNTSTVKEILSTEGFSEKTIVPIEDSDKHTTVLIITRATTNNYEGIKNISTVSTTQTPVLKPVVKKEDSNWSLVPTIVPHQNATSIHNEAKPQIQIQPAKPVVLNPQTGFGLDDSNNHLDPDIYQFVNLCNELAFGFWNSVTNGISTARSVFVSPFAATSLLAMVFLGARGATSGEMNEILKLDDMVTFNPHLIFRNVTESIESSNKSGVATSIILRELYSDKSKGLLLSFYKERAKQFYDGHVEEVSFKEVGDVVRKRTNLIVKRLSKGKIPEYIKDSSITVKSPLAGVSVSIFQTDCSEASTEGRDGELYFVVLPSIRQRRLIPVPAAVWRTGFLAGYEPGLDATAVSIGGNDQTISTIFVIPGQQGIAAPGDGLARLERHLVSSSFKDGSWSRLLRSLIPRPGLEVQIPRFAHKSIINATVALQHMGIKDLFDSSKADLRGLNGVANDLYLSDILQINSFATCGEDTISTTHHSEIYPATANRTYRRSRKFKDVLQPEDAYYDSELLEEPRDYQRAFHDPLHDPKLFSLPLPLRPRQARLPDAPRLRFDRPFLYFIRHNPTGLILHMGRFNPRLLP